MVDTAQNVVTLNPNQTKRKIPKIPGKTAIVKGVRNHLNTFLRDALMVSSEKLEETMYQKTVTDGESVISVDLAMYRNIKLNLNTNCREGMLRMYDMFWRGVPVSSIQDEKAGMPGELSLVDPEELEETLNIQILARKCEEKNFEALYGLNRRLGFMEGFEELKLLENPVAPSVLVNVFVEQLKQHSFSADAKKMMLDHFESHVLGQIQGLYKQINQLLAQGGILPTLPRPGMKSGQGPNKHSRSKSQDGAAAQRNHGLNDKVEARSDASTKGTGPAPATAGQRGTAQIHAIDPSLEADLKALFEQVGEKRPAREYEDGVRISGQAFESKELLGELTNLQKEDLYGQAAVGEVDLVALKTHLNQSLQANGERRPYLEQDESVIDIVAMFFDLVLEDHHLPDAVRLLIGRLQIPVLKVAMMDHSFFAKKSHPVRRLINGFSKAGLGICEQNTRIRNVVLDKMESLVDRILLEFEEDISLFIDILEEFEAFMAQQIQQIEIIEERSRKSSENNDRLELTKRQASFEIASRLNGRKAPLFVKEFLDNAWHDVLVLGLLRKEREPEEVDHCLGLIDLLVESVLVHEVVSERDRIMQALPRLLKDLRLGLEDISFDPYESSQWFKELEAWHLKVLSKQIPEDVVETPVLENVVVEDIMDVSERLIEDMPSDKFSRLAMKIDVDDWVEFSNDSDESVRARLSWKSEVTLKCMFVNDKGMKVLDLTLPELAEQLRSKRIKLVGNEQESLFDRAVSGLMNVFSSDESAPQPV